MVTSSSRDQGDVALWGRFLLLFLCYMSSSAHPSPHRQDMPPNFDTRTALACFMQSRGTLDLTCQDPAHSMVRIEQVAYHYAEDGSCLPSAAHCLFKEPELEPYPCVGRGSCSINTPTGGLGPELRACAGARATYMTVRYQCIPVSESVDVCSTRTLTSQWGFVTSPRYPLNYPSSVNCTLRVRTPHSGQRLTVRLIDLNLKNADAACDDWLELHDGHRSESYCNVRTDHHAMTTYGNWLQMKFQTDATKTRKGFWLYYEAFPYIDTPHFIPAKAPTTTEQQSTASTTPPYIPPSMRDAKPNNYSSSTTTTKPGPAFSEQRRQQARDSLTVGIIVGVVLGVLLCITVVLAVVLFIRKY